MDNPTCCGEVVKSRAMGKEFFYCRGCKKEISAPVDTVDALNYVVTGFVPLSPRIGFNGGGNSLQRVPGTVPQPAQSYIGNTPCVTNGKECAYCAYPAASRLDCSERRQELDNSGQFRKPCPRGGDHNIKITGKGITHFHESCWHCGAAAYIPYTFVNGYTRAMLASPHGRPPAISPTPYTPCSPTPNTPCSHNNNASFKGVDVCLNCGAIVYSFNGKYHAVPSNCAISPVSPEHSFDNSGKCRYCKETPTQIGVNYWTKPINHGVIPQYSRPGSPCCGDNVYSGSKGPTCGRCGQAVVTP